MFGACAVQSTAADTGRGLVSRMEHISVWPTDNGYACGLYVYLGQRFILST